MESTKMKVRVRKKSSTSPVSRTLSKEAKTISKDASPDSKCPICLDKFRNVSYVDKCLHRFCFRCIHEWTKNKAECPLCKQSFTSIYHTIKAEDDFKQFHLRPSDNGSFGNLAGQRFRYRTTLTGERRASARRTSPPPDHGVMFEGLAGGTGGRNERGFRHMLERLAGAWRRAQDGGTLRTPREQEMIRFRRALYRRGLWVQDVRDGGRSRDTTAEFFRRNPACLHRLVPWLKRELTVLYGTHGSLVNIVQHIIMSQITRYDMQDAAVLHELRPFLLSRTEHFLHEFLSFARAPFNMAAYDQHAVYDCPAPSAEDSSSSDVSVLAVSEDEGPAPQPDSGPAPELSHAAWDEETPGPSYSSEPPRVFTLPTTDSDTDSSAEEAGPSSAPPTQANARVDVQEGGSSDEEDCVIIGYVKPTAERTPELLQLSSDSDESVEEMLLPFSRPASSFLSSGVSASREESSDSHRASRQTSSKARPSQSEYHDTPSHRQKPSSKSHRRADRRHQSKKTRNCKSRSRNRDRERSSHRHRRRSRSRSNCSKERTRTKEVSGTSLSSWRLHTHQSYDGDRSSRYHAEKRASRRHVSPNSSSHSRARSRAHSRSWSRARSRSWSRARSRSRSWSRARSRSHSRARSCSKSWSRRAQDPRHSESRCRDSSPSSQTKLRHKPSGKRKCKSLHTEQWSKGSASVGSAHGGRRSKEEHHKKWRQRSRSPSVEIVYEDGSAEHRGRHHRKKKKKHKKSRRRRSRERTRNHSPPIITIPSDSEAHQEGAGTTLADSAHQEGAGTTLADSAHQEGAGTTLADSAHQEGAGTTLADSAHQEGAGTTLADSAHQDGAGTTLADSAHQEATGTTLADSAHQDGAGTTLADSAHTPPHSSAGAQLQSTSPSVHADAPHLSSATTCTASSLPLGGVVQLIEKQVAGGDPAPSSADEGH